MKAINHFRHFKPGAMFALIVFITMGYQNCAPAKYSTVMASSSTAEDVDSAGVNQGSGVPQNSSNTPHPPNNGTTDLSSTQPETDPMDGEENESENPPDDPNYDDLDSYYADYARVYHRIMSATFENVRMKDPIYSRERLISLDESMNLEACVLHRSVTKQSASAQDSKEIKMKFCSGYLIARSIREKVGACQPAEVELKSHSNQRVSIRRRIALDENCLCHYDREVEYTGADSKKSGLVERLHIRKRFAHMDACAEHFPEYRND